VEPRLDLITLGVRDLAVARAFYVDGLGWRPIFEVPGVVVFLQVGHGRALALFGADALDVDSEIEPVDRAGFPPLSLAQVVDTQAEVRAVIDRARAAGARIVKEPQLADFGGFHAYFADPDGFRWEIATNPGWRVDPDGRVHLGPIGD